MLLGVGIALCIAELTLRQVYRYPLALDPEFGQRIAPNSTVRWRTEGNGLSHWDALGARRSTHSQEAVSPVLALGDSFTEALMLDDDEVYTDRLEGILQQSGHAVAIRNAGKSTMSAADYIAHAPRYVRDFAPRWYIVQLRDDDLNADAWKLQPGTARFVFANGELAVEPARFDTPVGVKKAVFEARQASSLFGYGVVRFREFLKAAHEEPPLFRAASTKPTDVAPPPNFPVEAELQMLERALDRRVTILYLPAYSPSDPHSRTLTEQRVADECTKNGWSFVNLREAWPSFIAERSAPYGFPNTQWNTGHLNELGHAAAARLLANEIERLVKDAVF